MSRICPICHRYYDPSEDWNKAVCPRCYIPPKSEQPDLKSAELEPEMDDTEEWVVLFLAVDGPHELKRIVGKKTAQKYAELLIKGVIDDKRHHKDSQRIRVWKAEAFDNPRRGGIVIPVGSLDGIRAEDFDQGEYV